MVEKLGKPVREVFLERIVEGNAYSIELYAAALIDTGTIDLLVTVPAGIEPWVEFRSTNASRVVMEAWEDTLHIPASPENVITPIALNRNVVPRLGMTFNRDPINPSSPLADGFGSQIVGPLVGVASSRLVNLVLKPSTAYLFRTTNVAGAPTQTSMTFSFYEN